MVNKQVEALIPNERRVNLETLAAIDGPFPHWWARLALAVENAGDHLTVATDTQRRFCEMRARVAGRVVQITVADPDYDALVAYFTDRPGEIAFAEREWAHPAAALFRQLAPPGVVTTHNDMVATPWSARHGCAAFDGWMNDGLFKSASVLLPSDTAFLKPGHLAHFAAWQRRFDTHWRDVQASWAASSSSFKPTGFDDWITPAQRAELVRIAAGRPVATKTKPAIPAYDPEARCQAETGVGLIDLSRRAAEGLLAEWRETPAWRG